MILPEAYIVDTGGGKKQEEVADWFGNKYNILCYTNGYHITGETFAIDKQGHSNRDNNLSYNKSTYSSYPVISYEQWKAAITENPVYELWT